MSSVNLFYNETAVSPQSELVVIAQHNDYTRDYFLNQRFIIGYDRVYRIKAINKFYSNSTMYPTDVGLMRIYMEITEISPYDDFEHRIAAQADKPVIVSQEPDPRDDGGYEIKFSSPAIIPSVLEKDASSPVEFIPVLCDKNGNPVPNIPFSLSIELENLPVGVDPTAYYDCEIDGASFKISVKRAYLRGLAVLTWRVVAASSPSEEEITASFALELR